MSCGLFLLCRTARKSPSTMKSSHSSAFRDEQRVSFPPSDVLSPDFFSFLERSLAFLAASRAARARPALSMIPFAIFGFSSRKMEKCLEATVSTTARASVVPSLVFVCPSNPGRCPNVQNRRHSLPKILSREIFLLLPEPHPTSVLLNARAVRKPVSWPPSIVLMQFRANETLGIPVIVLEGDLD